ncbi:hypothetical protein M422DRAFT_30387 [Sphaerobolus stellatus SS14]|uniref:AMP-dependent synthetase/ligase domain-containing protein n=1 Tax=Sphaerobolus stellatus (strain SS14) TaxID=990650 RepID=A0A0C9VB55_SPHS4|nr:hypothetical protein M422DRAFT_30387 [Sphaerobolus stellatus SS14]
MPFQEPKVILYPKDFDYKKQSIEVPGSRKPGQTGIYLNAVWPELSYDSEQGRHSLYEVFQSGLEHSPNGPCLGHRPIISTNPLAFAPQYEWQTYRQVDERRRNLGSALEHIWQQGRAGGGDLPTIGIWSQNKPEWQIVDLAAQAYSKVTVSLYDTLGPNAVEYSCNHAEITVVFATTPHIPEVLSLAPKLKGLKVLVSMDELSDEARHVASSWAKHRGLEFFTLREFEALGKANYTEPIIPTPEHVYSICYTSGTTGNPKGAILTHGQVAMAIAAAVTGTNFTEPGYLMSYLPLAHIYGRITELAALNFGGGIGYFTGDPLRLLEDAQSLRPTAFPSVPRVLNRIYQAANMAGDVPGLKGNIFRKAVATKLANYRATGKLTHLLWDRLVFSKIQKLLGGRIESITSGSAPISADALDFLRIAFGCDIYNGYGMTETAAIITRVVSGDRNPGDSSGPPQAGVELKLLDVAEMGYTANDKPNPRGEILCRSICNTPGYYKDPENTANTIDAEGWLHTGDIGEIDSAGRLRIIDRVKNIMKLAQGEYVALEKVENAYSGSPCISQIFVHGDSLKDHLIAVIVPDAEHVCNLVKRLHGHTIHVTDEKAVAEAIRDLKVKSALFEEINKQGKKSGLKGFESVKKILLTMDMFTAENGTLTPTFKIKRKEAYTLHKAELDALYNEPLPTTGGMKVKL